MRVCAFLDYAYRLFSTWTLVLADLTREVREFMGEGTRFNVVLVRCDRR